MGQRAVPGGSSCGSGFDEQGTMHRLHQRTLAGFIQTTNQGQTRGKARLRLVPADARPVGGESAHGSTAQTMQFSISACSATGSMPCSSSSWDLSQSRADQRTLQTIQKLVTFGGTVGRRCNSPRRRRCNAAVARSSTILKGLVSRPTQLSVQFKTQQITPHTTTDAVAFIRYSNLAKSPSPLSVIVMRCHWKRPVG